MPYHHVIEFINQAPEPLVALARQSRSAPRAVAMFVMHDGQERGTVPSLDAPRNVLRDRTSEYKLMLKGLAQDLNAEIWQQDFTGTELYQLGLGFEVVGANFTKTFRLLVV